MLYFENDYTELLNIVQNKHQLEAIDKFVEDKLKDTYIIIDPLFGDCDFTRKGWASKIRKED